MFRISKIGNLCIASLLAFVCSSSVAQTVFDRPNPDRGSTEIRIRYALIDIDDIDSAKQSFTANFYYEARWVDPRLAHNGSESITLPLNDVWHPRIQLLNIQRVIETLSRVVEVTPAGEVIYRQRVWGPFSQPLNLKDFPFDKQTFKIILTPAGSEFMNIELVADTKNKSMIAPQFSVPDWEITEWLGYSEDSVFVDEFETKTDFVIQFNAKRKVGYYLIKVLFPLLLIVAMSWIVFWINPEHSGTQIGVSTTSMLTLIAYRFSVDTILPRISYLTRLDLFVLVSTIVVFATLLEAVVTVVFASNGRKKLALTIDRYCRVIFPLMLILLFVAAFVI